MKQLANRRALVLGLSVGAIGVGSILAACSGSSTQNGGTNNGGDGGGGGGGGGVSNTPGSCASPTVPLSFSPMYSAFIPNSTAHTFQIPAIVNDGSTATWSSSDPKIVALAPDSTSGGVMITVQGVGPVTIFATKSDGTCGASVLNITSSTENDWTIGSARYNDGVALTFGGGGGGNRPDGGFPDGGFQRPDGGGGGGGFQASDGGSFLELDGGTACTNCHGPTASSVFKDVSHTPEQTGGFSDSDLIAIITQGIVPDGGYFDPDVILADASADPTGARQARAYAIWQTIHKWNDITPDEQPGIIVYLRSLQPEPQGGTSNFGGPKGDGGTHHHDGGGQPPPQQDSGSVDTDAGGSTDAASE